MIFRVSDIFRDGSACVVSECLIIFAESGENISERKVADRVGDIAC